MVFMYILRKIYSILLLRQVFSCKSFDVLPDGNLYPTCFPFEKRMNDERVKGSRGNFGFLEKDGGREEVEEEKKTARCDLQV